MFLRLLLPIADKDLLELCPGHNATQGVRILQCEVDLYEFNQQLQDFPFRGK